MIKYREARAAEFFVYVLGRGKKNTFVKEVLAFETPDPAQVSL
jgi:hypothetical protein